MAGRSNAVASVALVLGSVAALLTLLARLPGQGWLTWLIGGDLFNLALFGVVVCGLALSAAWPPARPHDRARAALAMALGLVPVASVAYYLTTGEG